MRIGGAAATVEPHARNHRDCLVHESPCARPGLSPRLAAPPVL